MGPLKMITLTTLFCSALTALLASPIDQDYIDDAFETGEISRLDPGIIPEDQTSPPKTKEQERLPDSPVPLPVPVPVPVPSSPISLPDHEDISAEFISLYTLLACGGLGSLAAFLRLLYHLHQAGRLGFNFANEVFGLLQLLRDRSERRAPIALPSP